MKRKLINSFIILSASSAIAKLFSILNRMILARQLSDEAMALYFLVMPTVSLCITLGQLGIPSAVFRLIANPKYNNKKIIISAITISLFACIIVMSTLLFSSKFISHNLLKNDNAFLPLLALILFIPLVGISGIIKNYFLAKQNVFLVAKAGFVEEMARLSFSYLMIRTFLYLNDTYLVTIAMLAMSVGELSSILYLLTRLKKQNLITIKKSEIKPSLQIKDMLNIAMPLTGSRLYQCLVSFLEPIVLVFVLTKLGFDKSLIHNQYAIISGYVISLLVTPSFFNGVIYRLILPIITNDVVYHQIKAARYHLLIASLGSVLISVPFTVIFYFYPENCLQLLYNTTSGANYLKYMAIPFTIYYLGTPLSALLQALNKNRLMFIISIVQCSLELALVFTLSRFLGVFSIAISTLIGIIFTVSASMVFCYKYLFIDN
ncbi:oligosaccharide flippase family protein [Thomasclavelia sp.]|uniref:oligosaccharide flippase family protein n=1 Tax=Thomasclavelia sp. TaxID=3025757 RepID=UPI0025FEE08E|nr:oligosaccharide flippase family protein [Thomasclavelia sp.]